jgi:hypothetical protein
VYDLIAGSLIITANMSSRNDCRNSSDPSKASRKSAWIWVLIMAGLLRRFAMWYAKQRSRDLWERMEACMKLASKGSFDASVWR